MARRRAGRMCFSSLEGVEGEDGEESGDTGFEERPLTMKKKPSDDQKDGTGIAEMEEGTDGGKVGGKKAGQRAEKRTIGAGRTERRITNGGDGEKKAEYEGSLNDEEKDGSEVTEDVQFEREVKKEMKKDGKHDKEGDIAPGPGAGAATADGRRGGGWLLAR